MFQNLINTAQRNIQAEEKKRQQRARAWSRFNKLREKRLEQLAKERAAAQEANNSRALPEVAAAAAVTAGGMEGLGTPIANVYSAADRQRAADKVMLELQPGAAANAAKTPQEIQAEADASANEKAYNEALQEKFNELKKSSEYQGWTDENIMKAAMQKVHKSDYI